MLTAVGFGAFKALVITNAREGGCDWMTRVT